MVHQGDAAAGKALFLNSQKIACALCHTTDGQGGKAGPDLFAIGDKYGRDDLIQQVLFPSATIAVGYSTTVIHTKSGDILQGIIKESNDQIIGLMGSDGKLIRIPTADIDHQQHDGCFADARGVGRRDDGAAVCGPHRVPHEPEGAAVDCRRDSWDAAGDPRAENALSRCSRSIRPRRRLSTPCGSALFRGCLTRLA